MVYARLNVTRVNMFQQVAVNMFYPEPGAIPARLRRVVPAAYCAASPPCRAS